MTEKEYYETQNEIATINEYLDFLVVYAEVVNHDKKEAVYKNMEVLEKRYKELEKKILKRRIK